MEYEEVDDKTKYQAYAAYDTVKWFLVLEHKKMLDLFEQISTLHIYRENYIPDTLQTKYFELRCKLQSKLSRLKTMYKDYASVKEEKKNFDFEKYSLSIHKVFDVIGEAEKNGKMLKFEVLYMCKEALATAQFALGLNDIEVKKEDTSDPDYKW